MNIYDLEKQATPGPYYWYDAAGHVVGEFLDPEQVRLTAHCRNNFMKALAFIERCSTETDGLRWRYHKLGEVCCEPIADDAKKLLAELEEVKA